MKVLSIFATTIAAVSAFAPVSNTQRLSNTQLFADAGEEARAQIQFVRGLEEKVIPQVKLTRARDGSSGTATFLFDNPNVFDASTASQGEITGLFMTDEEGELSTTDVNARFANGKVSCCLWYLQYILWIYANEITTANVYWIGLRHEEPRGMGSFHAIQ